MLPVVLLITAAPAAPLPARSTPLVHYPPDELVISGKGLLHVLVELPESGRRQVEVRINGGPAGAVVTAQRPAPGGQVFHAPVQLVPGLNTIAIAAREGGSPGVTVERRVFHLAPLWKETEPPPRFSRRPFHQAGLERACAGCHATGPRPEDAAPSAPEQSTCRSCHAGMTAAKEVHGPAALWACTRCHDARGAPAGYETPEPVMPLCFSCHIEQKEHFLGNRYQHGPTATGHCTICHDPHGTDQRFFIKKAAWDLCTTCHFEKASGRHVISWGPSGQGHPTRGKPDPTRPGRELSCASCHNPHAAPAPRLWNFKATMWLDLCRNCHGGIVGG